MIRSLWIGLTCGAFGLACGHDPVESGGQIYAAQCATCHGSDGTAGVQVNGVSAADLPSVVPTVTDEVIRSTIEDGLREMPRQNLGTRDVEDCIAWLRDTFGGPP